MNRWTVILAALAMAGAMGCAPIEYTLHKSAASECPDSNCHKDLKININNECLDKMREDGKWVEGVPQEVIDNCHPVLGPCLIPNVWGGTFAIANCDCHEVTTGYRSDQNLADALLRLDHAMCEELKDCCQATAANLPQVDQDAATNAAQDVVDQLRNYGCSVDDSIDCELRGWTCAMQIPCEGGAKLAALGVRARPDCASTPSYGPAPRVAAAADELLFRVAPQRSYVQVTSPFPTLDVPLSGSLRVGKSPLRFVAAEVSAAAASYAGQSLSGWVFGLAQPIPFSFSDNQTFVIPANAIEDIVGWGEIGGAPIGASFARNAPTRGTFDPAARTWSLDYAESGPGWTMRVHLEGSVVQPR